MLSVSLCPKWNSTESQSKNVLFWISLFSLPFETPEFDPFANECPAAVHNLNRLILDWKVKQEMGVVRSTEIYLSLENYLQFLHTVNFNNSGDKVIFYVNYDNWFPSTTMEASKFDHWKCCPLVFTIRLVNLEVKSIFFFFSSLFFSIAKFKNC